MTKNNSLNLSQQSGVEIYNKIFFGPPGTGKSYKVKELTKDSKNIFRVTFHEDYSYYDFVGQYKPIVIKDYVNKISTKPDPKDSEKEPSPVISYEFVPGLFIDSYVTAHNNKDEDVYLIIEEINRGNCSAIFGDIFQLLDRDEMGSKYLKEKGIEYDNLSLPPNLKILATMNTSDQSLFPIDSAFKRRWQQEYCKIEYNNVLLKNILIEGTNQKWLDFIAKVNERVLTLLNNEDKQIGHWFVQPTNNLISQDDFKYKVMSYLYYDVFKHNRPQIFNENSFAKIVDKSIAEIVHAIMG
jgi:5-methylcytosine-specific restriction endonuclease McrBC GTP-binding regulatory subunit McrB